MSVLTTSSVTWQSGNARAPRGPVPEPIRRLLGIPNILLLVFDCAGEVAGISKPAEIMLGYTTYQLLAAPAAMVLPVFNRVSPANFQLGLHTVAICADGSMLRLRIRTLTLQLIDFDGWAVVLRTASRFKAVD